MEYLLDTASIEEIRKYSEYLPIAGVTSNPSIVKKEGKIDFFGHMKTIRDIIGMERPLHIQVTATDVDGILRDAESILRNVDESVYIKIPVDMNGLKAIKLLKSQGHNVTGTAIYSAAQGLLAVEAGADYLAPYYNRMENLNMYPEETIHTMALMIEKYAYKTKIVAASFKNMGQVNKAFLAGAHAATVDPSIVVGALAMPDIAKAVEDFQKDWKSIYGDKRIADL